MLRFHILEDDSDRYTLCGRGVLDPGDDCAADAENPPTCKLCIALAKKHTTAQLEIAKAKTMTTKTKGHYTVKGVPGTFKTMRDALKAADFKPLLTYHNAAAVLPRKGETWSAGPAPAFTNCTILNVDGFTSVIFSAVDPLNQPREFMLNVEAFIKLYRKVKS